MEPIVTGANAKSIKSIREAENAAKEKELRAKCEALAVERWGEEEIKKLSNANKGLWYLVIQDEDGNIEKLAIMKPIDRNILSYASTKIQDDGLYAYLESCMHSCWLQGDDEIMGDDAYFIPAANSFNKILEGKKAALVKR